MLKILIGIIFKQTVKVGDSLNTLSNLIMNLMDKMNAEVVRMSVISGGYMLQFSWFFFYISVSPL